MLWVGPGPGRSRSLYFIRRRDREPVWLAIFKIRALDWSDAAFTARLRARVPKPRTLASPSAVVLRHRHGDGCRHREARRSEEAAAEPIAALRRGGSERAQAR